MSGKTGRGILLVVVCRKLRTVFIEQIIKANIKAVHRAFKRIKKRSPEIKTITTDNDLLLQKHKDLEKILNVKIYFCNLYHSWEKGGVENAIGLIREFIPKKSDLAGFSDEYISAIIDRINNTPMKCLGFKTPKEIFEGRYLLKINKEQCCASGVNLGPTL